MTTIRDPKLRALLKQVKAKSATKTQRFAKVGSRHYYAGVYSLFDAAGTRLGIGGSGDREFATKQGARDESLRKARRAMRSGERARISVFEYPSAKRVVNVKIGAWPKTRKMG